MQLTDWNSLLRVLATRATLETVKLCDALSADQRNNASAGLVRAFLQTIQQNSSIRSVELCCLRLPNSVSMFLGNVPSTTSLRLFMCDMEPTEREQGVGDLAAALRRSKNIQSLRLNRLDDIYAVPILEGLGNNTSVKTFIFSPTSDFTNTSDVVSHALQELLESTTSIQRFELESSVFYGDAFRPIAQAITGSECVSELKFVGSRFEDQSSLAQFRSILQNKRNLTSLRLTHCGFGRGQVDGDITSILSRPDSPLRCFEFDRTFRMESEVQFENLLRAIVKSKLERFQIGSIETLQQLQALTRSIPSMKLKELDVWIRHGEDDEEGEFGRESIRHDLLHALKNNFSLRSVKGKHPNGTDFFDSDDDKQRLALYATAATRVWINGSTIPRQSSSKKCGRRHWDWHKGLGPMLCFAVCVRFLSVIT